jgi:hypothetical protein
MSQEPLVLPERLPLVLQQLERLPLAPLCHR